MSAVHELKTWPDFFQAILDGRKTFEVRYDDRGFQAGDTVRLREFDPELRPTGLTLEERLYTGREITARIGYVLHAIPHAFRGRHLGGVQPGHNLDGYVVFSLLDVEVNGDGQ